MKVSYDKATDTFYLFLTDQAETVARDVGKGILVKFDENNKPVGVVIHDFEQRFKKPEPSAIDIPLNILVS